MNVIDQIKRDEQLRLKVYRDTSDDIGFEGKKGKLTTAWGANIEEIDQEEADFLLLHRYVNRAQKPVRENIPWSQNLSEPRLAVLENMCYNMGINRLLTFRKALAAGKAGDYALSSLEMLDSKWATQTGARAQRLAKQFETGVWV